MVFDRLVTALGRLSSWGFLLIAFMMLWEVIARYGFNAPTFWAHEIAGVVAAIAFILGGAYCMVDRSHMRITLLLDRMPPLLRRTTEVVSHLVGLIYLGGLAWAMWIIFHKSVWKFGADGGWTPETSGSSWNTAAPAIVKLALLIGAVLFFIAIARQLLLRGERQADASGRDHADPQ